MAKRLDELYKGESNHKSLWSRAKEGLANRVERVKERHDTGFKKFQQIKQAPGPIPHPTDSSPKPSDDDGKLSMGKGLAGAAIGGLLGPWGAAAGAIIGSGMGKKNFWKKK